MVSGFQFWDLCFQFHWENLSILSFYQCSSEEMKCDLRGSCDLVDPCDLGGPGSPGGQGGEDYRLI